jgi:predicted porin
MAFSFVKTTMAMAVLGGAASLASAQSSVQLYGIVDAAIRHTNNEGPNKGGLTKMIGGGMSQSRWGINVTEDLGGGLSAIANLENRFTADDGVTPAPGLTYFAQSWVGLRSQSFGQITMGRQYNVLFDLVTSTYASFPYSPYMEAYKPELGMAMGARANNMLKYAASFGPVRAGLQYSFDEGNTVARKGAATDLTPGLALKTAGGYLRYSDQGISVGAGYLSTKLPGGSKVDAWSLGGSYRTGPWYLMAGYAANKRKDDLQANLNGVVDSGVLNAFWTGASNGGFVAGSNPLNAANKREMFKIGVGYQITPQLNAGLHYYHAKQKGSATGAFNGKADFIVAVADYAFSKRTDAYFGVDHTKVSGGAGVALDGTNGATKRTGITVGLRHRF